MLVLIDMKFEISSHLVYLVIDMNEKRINDFRCLSVVSVIIGLVYVRRML